MSTLIPRQNEDEFAFTERAHESLKKSIPDFFARNKKVWEMWDSHAGKDRCSAIADSLLGDRYVDLGEPVAYFTEHKTIGRDGKPRHYTKQDLIEIAKQQNFNGSERGRFAAISDDHTTDNHADKQPNILGFAVRYRLGVLGTEDPVWTIFATERAAKPHVERLSQLPRRSVELLTDLRTGSRLFDPIAALGARAPRLSMPGRYTVEGHVERYSFDAGGGGMYPGPSNTKLEQFDHEGQSMDMNNDALRQIVEAIQSLPEIQWVRTQMTGGGAPIAPQPGAEIGPAPGGPGADMMGGGMGGPMGGGDMGGGFPPGGGGAGEEPDKDDQQYSLDPRFAQDYVQRERYEALQRQVGDLQRMLKAQVDQISVLANSRTDANRTSRLRELESKYRGFVSANEEMGKCLYSAGSKMTDDQFDDYVENIERFAAKAQITSVQRLPSGVETSSAPQNGLPDRHSEEYAKLANAAVERYTADLDAGREVLMFDEYVLKIHEEMTGRK